MSSILKQRILGFPRRYIQGAGVLEDIISILAPMPKPIGVVIEPSVLELLPDAVADQVHAIASDGILLQFKGECTRTEIARLASQASTTGVRSILAVGGGKTLDTGKGVAKAVNAEIAISPTIASNDAPTSRLIVLYHADHRVDGVEYLAWNPAMVIVDTQVIAQAPTRFLRAGIGDALSKRFELDQVIRAGGQNFFGTPPSAIASAFAATSFATLMENAEEALEACDRSSVNEALENVVEACVLASGAGFENGGLSLAHAMCRGLSACDETNSALHGEMVAFALLVQLRLTREGGADLDHLIAFYESVGLPLRFEDLGAKRAVSAGKMQIIAQAMLDAPYITNFERALDADEVIWALEEQQGCTTRRRPDRASYS